MLQLQDIQRSLSDDMRRESRRITALGVVALGLGIYGFLYIGAITITSVLVFGAALVIAGVYHLVHAVRYRDWIGLLFDTPIGITETVAGAVMLTRPGASLLGLTLLVAAFLVTSGIFRTVVSAALKFPNWGWSLASGIVSIVLGLMVWSEWPVSALWVLGAFVSAYLVVSGASYIMLGLAVREAFPKPAPAQPRPQAQAAT